MLKLFCFASVVLLTLSSCRKAYEYIHDHPDAHDSFCRIATLKVRGVQGDPDSFTISYNVKGDPVRSIFPPE